MPTTNRNAKKERILNAALKLFSQQGYHATTTKEIAAESGVAEGLIFYHFGDKRKLLLYLVNNFSFVTQLQEEAGELSKLPAEEALIQFGMAYLQFLRTNMDYLMLIWSPELMKDAEVSNEVSQLIGGFGTAGSSILKQAAGSKHQPEHTVQTAMMMMTSSILVYCMLHTRFGQETLPLGDESYIRELVRLLMHGLTEES
ncbi:TetR/AcrR family transcriptional regulator [Paenibacillus sp. MDMC362]|uniref:TetR/AcrR family transcriptional regulator n=1 Tax=Paenibacillus sp. MDMC362 TaxID=2977365 RepID=UPI000DC2E766|nr:TetR/AcrR family transcriptional regulator [Paenibacillus sp. MDMC362]RAR41368.1 TetR/AcrR family transcriptional regulator [Paenibacillus sp. MDMC362]